MKSNSQASQDNFVITVLKQKKNGCFLEIGANHPITHSNTYLLESEYDWKGLMVEYDKNFEPLYQLHRKRSIYAINDARKVNYKQILESNNFPKNMDYLQIDLDVDNKSTLNTLELLDDTILDTYKFATVTFEHDIYRGNFHKTRELSRNIFAKRGYLLVFPDIQVFWEGRYVPFEDWYVHPDLVDMGYINKVKTNETLTHEQIKELLRKQNN